MVKKILRPIEQFMHLEASGGIMLILAALVATIMANSPLHHLYHDILHFPVILEVGSLNLHGTLHHWVNDALMVIFFFVVGLEIKRELIAGELSTPKKAALPMFAALGGMLVPALIYAALNIGEVEGAILNGWGIPMATDIAFAVGVLTLLGKRVPFSLKIFLLALAIVDDLGAVFVIAAFYTSDISAQALGFAAFFCMAMLFCNAIGFRSVLLYVVLGFLVWLGFFKSGVHATIAGVVIGLITPSRALLFGDELGHRVKDLTQNTLNKLRFFEEEDTKVKLSDKDRKTLFELQDTAFEGLSPLDRLIDQLHPWVTFFIMPLFAFFNAGVVVSGEAMGQFLSSPVSLGVVLGLVVGKPIGILIFSALAVMLKMADLPSGVTWTHVTGLGFLGGVGFTMSLFVTGLAISDPFSTDLAKMGILIASLLASLAGSAVLIFAASRSAKKKET